MRTEHFSLRPRATARPARHPLPRAALRRRSAGIAIALAALCGSVAAESSVTITGRAPAPAGGVAGFGDAPAARAPLQTSSFGAAALADQGVVQFGALPRLDASIGEAYNAEGYWAGFSMRGYALDPRFNTRRDGLPISGETALALEGLERIEIFKGTSGIQAGTSAPGGLVNLVVKRPVGTLSGGRLEWRESGSVLAAVDLGERFGADRTLGLRLNAAAERLDPAWRDTRGRRSLLAAALDWQAGPDTLLQAEVERSTQRQPSVVGYSLLGDVVPAADSTDPRRNLNLQPWREDVVFGASTASLRWQQRLGDDWRFTLHGMRQQLDTNDRTAFPYGRYDPLSFDCEPCDRFASDGSFTYWQYISNGERRTSDALQAQLAGRWRQGGVTHAVEVGVLATRYRGRFQDQVFDIAGPGRIDGSLDTPPSSGFLDANTNRDERSTEWFVRDAMQLGARWQLWAGLRHAQIGRESVRTSADADGSLRATDFERSATTPWLALALQLAPRTMVYTSWGRGLEADVAPNRARYANAGASLALTSRQLELGIKHGDERVEAALTLFDIDRDVAADLGVCAAAGTCMRAADGSARHRGVEAALQGEAGAYGWRVSAMRLDAARRGSQQPGVNGQRPVNVPSATLRALGEMRLPALPGLALSAGLVAESDRVVLPYDERVHIPGWGRLDLGARWQHGWKGATLTWRLGVDNASDRRAWKESPYQFGHAYLYPLAPRTWRASLHAAF
jgi:iron complex outermembrane receptor protein